MHCRFPDSKALTPGRELEKSNLELPSLLRVELPQSLISLAGKIIERAKCQIHLWSNRQRHLIISYSTEIIVCKQLD